LFGAALLLSGAGVTRLLHRRRFTPDRPFPGCAAAGRLAHTEAALSSFAVGASRLRPFRGAVSAASVSDSSGVTSDIVLDRP
jgi:hypothetical protein